MADLATELSFGAVAGLGLAPGDPRFASLSKQALRGGATRFASAVDSAWPVRYVIPVRVLEDELAPGALIVQQERLALVWQSPSGFNQSVWSVLDDKTLVFESMSRVDDEPWPRFRVEDAEQSWSFLVPPVRGRLLISTLRQNLEPWLRPEPQVFHEPAETKVMPAITDDEPEPRQWVHKSSPQPDTASPVGDAVSPTVEMVPGTVPVAAPDPIRKPTAVQLRPVQPRSVTLMGFLIGLAATLVIGGGWLVLQLVG